MPRANRHYLPGYVWHITHRWESISWSDQVNHMKDKRNAVNSALIIALEGYF
jgi:hypothetical protein